MPQYQESKESILIQQTRTLTSLAILKVDIDERQRSYLDYLIPFILDVLVSHRQDAVTDELVTQLLEANFGLKVPIKGVHHVLRRMAKDGRYLQKENDVFFTVADLPDVGISKKRRDAVTRIQRVYDSLCRFVPSVQSTGVVWDDNDAAKAILAFLGRFTVDCLKSYVFNTALPIVPEGDSKELYIVSRFLKHVYENDRPLFEDFIVLVKGQMYANALTCPDLESLEKKFGRVTFYLDTPLILNLLGLHGEGLRQVTQELITLIRDLKGSLAIFSHTSEEVKGVLEYAAENLDNPHASSKILREVRNTNTTLSDLLVMIGQLEEKLAPLHVRVLSTPTYSNHNTQIDESTFQNVLEDEVHYHGKYGVRYDINSVRSIYALRQSISPARLEDAGAVFVTSNSAFARAAFDFGKTHNSTREVSSVVTDYSLANVAWLKAPLKRPLLPEKETLAICYAALEPGKELFNKYVAMMDQLRSTESISEQEHAILRLSPLAQKELMDLTLGDEKALTGSGLREILDRVKQNLVEEQKKIDAEERIRIEKELAEAKRFLETQKNTHQEMLARQLERERLLGEKKEELQTDRADVLSTASRRARIVSKVITYFFIVGLSILLLFGAAAASGLFTVNSLDFIFYRIIFVIVIVIAVIWSWYNWITGKTLRGLTHQLENHIAVRLFKWITGKPVLPE